MQGNEDLERIVRASIHGNLQKQFVNIVFIIGSNKEGRVVSRRKPVAS